MSLKNAGPVKKKMPKGPSEKTAAKKPRKAKVVVEAEEPLTIPKDIIAKAGQLRVAKQLIEGQSALVKELSASLLEFVESTGRKNIDLGIGTVTRVQTEPLVIDEAKLKKAVGASVWKKITTQTLDKKKLDALLKSGEIETIVLASVSELVPGKPFIRTVFKADGE